MTTTGDTSSMSFENMQTVRLKDGTIHAMTKPGTVCHDDNGRGHLVDAYVWPNGHKSGIVISCDEKSDGSSCSRVMDNNEIDQVFSRLELY